MYTIKKNMALIMLTSLFISGMQAQSLQRKAILGILMSPLNDSIATSMGVSPQAGLYINQVLPNSTAAQLDMKAGNILQAINDQPVATNQDVFRILSQFRTDDVITVSYLSDGKRITKTGKGTARPQESYEHANIHYGQVNYPDNQLRSILYTPKGVDKAPVVYFIQGYTCSSIDLPFAPNSPTLQLIHDWVDAGYAVFRIEKPGMGDSQSKTPCSEIDFQQELTAFKEGYKSLLAMPNINKDAIFLFGHSMGGVIAPFLNDVYNPKGIMTYGTVAKPWYEYMIDIYKEQPKIFGTTASQIKENNKVELPFIKDIFIHKMTAKELLENEEYRTFLGASVPSFREGQYIGRHLRFWQTLGDADIANAWRRTNTNVLSLHGEFDIQAISDEGATDIVRLVNQNTKTPLATFVLIPKTDHGFILFDSMQHNVNALSDGSYRQRSETHFNHKIPQETILWMNKLVKK